jgi:hypothetical protein
MGHTADFAPLTLALSNTDQISARRRHSEEGRAFQLRSGGYCGCRSMSFFFPFSRVVFFIGSWPCHPLTNLLYSVCCADFSFFSQPSVGGRVLLSPTPQVPFLPLTSVCGRGGLDCGDSGGRVHQHPRADTRKLYVFLFSLLKGYYFYRFVALPPTNQPTILCVLR